MKFHDRSDAGRRLAEELRHLKDKKPVVLALPRGGVPVGIEIAKALAAPLDLVLVRKIGVPWQPELALGAVTDGEHPQTYIDHELATALAIPDDYVKEETARQVEELERRRQVYCAGRAPVDIAGSTAIVVDDGIATGATMRVALQAVRRRNPGRSGSARAASYQALTSASSASFRKRGRGPASAPAPRNGGRRRLQP